MVSHLLVFSCLGGNSKKWLPEEPHIIMSEKPLGFLHFLKPDNTNNTMSEEMERVLEHLKACLTVTEAE